MKAIPRTIVTLAVMSFFVFSCAPSAKQKPAEPAGPATVKQKKQMPVKEQEEGAKKLFNDIYEFTMENERLQILPKIAAMYEQLISEYPDSVIAEEVHWRLIRIYIVDMHPAREQDAERIFKAFKSGYTNSTWMPVVEDQMARFYYSAQNWEKLLWITTPTVVDYIKTGAMKNPFFLFLYSESKFYLNDDLEAEKGYLTVIQHFKSGSYEYKVSQERLKAITSRKK